MLNWFLRLSIRWKLQLGFFMVTMITTVFNRLLAVHELDKMIELARTAQVSALVIQELEGNRSTYIFNSIWESGIEFTIQFIVIGLVARFLMRPIFQLREALLSMEKGDLRVSLPETAQDEIGQLQSSFNVMRQRLVSILREIGESSRQVHQSAFQVTTMAHEIAEIGRKEQIRSQDVSDATIALKGVAEKVQQQASASFEISEQLEVQGREGILSVQRNIRALDETADDVSRASVSIAELETGAAQINAIIGTIKDIAGQTNLLALNAAIEAARAGEQGRGFAVVADEVRKLAERSANSAEEVTAIIERLNAQMGRVTTAMGEVVTQVHSSRDVASETEQAIREMVEKITIAAENSRAINQGSQSQMDQCAQLDEVIQVLFFTIWERSSMVDVTASIGSSVYRISEQLNEVMTNFQIDYPKVAERRPGDKRSFPRAESHLLVHLTIGDKQYEGLTQDLSLGGMRLETGAPLTEGMLIPMQLAPPATDLDPFDIQNCIHLNCRVMWAREENGQPTFGLSFENSSAATETALKQCIEYFEKPTVYA